MVKNLDDNSFPPLIDHVGWRLGRLFRRWKIAFDAEMVARGFGFMAEARGAVIGNLRPAGASQTTIAQALGISKQAVQQLVDELETEGVVMRIGNPADARGKLVVLTAKGAEAIRVGNEVKREIEASYRRRLGEPAFTAMMEALDGLWEDPDISGR